MNTALSAQSAYNGSGLNGAHAPGVAHDYLVVMIAEQKFGIPILQIQDVLSVQSVTRIPLAPKEIKGSLNLRGRIVTAIDVKTRLGIDALESNQRHMNVVVEYGEELYSLIVDGVGDVLSLQSQNFEKNPTTLHPVWRDISLGIYMLDGELLVALDIPKLIDTVQSSGRD